MTSRKLTSPVLIGQRRRERGLPRLDVIDDVLVGKPEGADVLGIREVWIGAYLGGWVVDVLLVLHPKPNVGLNRSVDNSLIQIQDHDELSGFYQPVLGFTSDPVGLLDKFLKRVLGRMRN